MRRRRLRCAVAFAVSVLFCAGAPAQEATPAEGATRIEAEEIEGVGDLEVSARGNAELHRDGLTVYGESLRWNRETGRLEASGGVRLERPGERYRGERLRYDTRLQTGEFESPAFRIEETLVTRGAAERLEFLGPGRLRLFNGWYTTCEPGREDWRFEAREIELDREAEEARVRDGRLRFFDTTLLPLPRATIPLENRRKTGLLTPFYAQSTSRGLELGVPFYWNIAPEQDLTLTPVVMSKRGTQLRTEYRYLERHYAGQLRWEYLPEDRVLERSRIGLSLQHEHRFSPALVGRLDLNRVSDARYFVDLGTHVRQVSVGNLLREGFLQYAGTWGAAAYQLSGRVQRFQTLQDPAAPIVSPYHRVPQLNLAIVRSDLAGAVDVALPLELVRFTHERLVQGRRVSANPTLAVPFVAPAGFFVPKLGLRLAGYALSQTATGQPQRERLTVPWLSLDTGLFFERDLTLRGTSFLHTLEPRLFYVYAPYRAQDALPLFDTGLADFNYATLFSENRFVGGDRFGDANQLTAALASRLLTPEGAELVRAAIGQRFYFRNERVGLIPNVAPRAPDQSDLLAAIGGQLFGRWSFDAGLQYNPQQARAERSSIALRYAPEPAKVVSASYRFLRDQLRQIDVSGQWPVAPGWYAIGRYNYSLREGRLLEGIAGVEYNAGCWLFRGVVQRLQAAVGVTSTAVYLQLEFSGFGSLATGDTLEFLRRAIPGYTPTSPVEGSLVPPSLRPRLPFELVY